jgi:serine phosphatase RsbU (regulator of sigma subunit)
LDASAYQEFALIFRPILREHLLRKGLPLQQAEGLAADSLNAVLGKVREYRPERAHFRSWICCLADARYQAWLRRLCGLQRDLESAAVTQLALLPDARQSLPGLDAYFVHRPVRVVTGDLCQISLLGNSTAISMGDARGKGASAALYGTVTQSWLRAFVRPEISPARLLSQLDGALKTLQAGTQYATLLHAVWQPRQSRFVMASAGAPPPAVLRGADLEWVQDRGPGAGLADAR